LKEIRSCTSSSLKAPIVAHSDLSQRVSDYLRIYATDNQCLITNYQSDVGEEWK
jgi:hypothetical protein